MSGVTVQPDHVPSNGTSNTYGAISGEYGGGGRISQVSTDLAI